MLAGSSTETRSGEETQMRDQTYCEITSFSVVHRDEQWSEVGHIREARFSCLCGKRRKLEHFWSQFRPSLNQPQIRGGHGWPRPVTILLNFDRLFKCRLVEGTRERQATGILLCIPQIPVSITQQNKRESRATMICDFFDGPVDAELFSCHVSWILWHSQNTMCVNRTCRSKSKNQTTLHWLKQYEGRGKCIQSSFSNSLFFQVPNGK